VATSGTKPKPTADEFDRFRDLTKKLVSVSKEELKRREERDRKDKQGTKSEKNT
jgi:hypothetical protein